jgi:protein gp37
MAQKTKIEWTDASWNPIRGCSRVSEGCRNCYAEHTAARFSGPGKPYEGLAEYKTIQGPPTVAGEASVGKSERTRAEKVARWTGVMKFVPEHLEDPLRWKRPRRIFVNSMSDLFHEGVPDKWIHKIFLIMACSPRHTFQILTKRPERMRAYCSSNQTRDIILRELVDMAVTIPGVRVQIGPPIADGLDGITLPNVWLGVSVEDQATADARIPLLLQTPAAVRFISAEPLLGDLDLYKPLHCCARTDHVHTPERGCWRRLDWVIVGGESGPHARPMNPAWARSVRDQCQDAEVPFFFKQWGEYSPNVLGTNDTWPPARIGKKAAGRELDGRLWDEYPAQTAV